jgi:hypothetical protein
MSYLLVHGRIEDTDVARSTKESEEAVLRDLAWLGIKWDEGPRASLPAATFKAPSLRREHQCFYWSPLMRCRVDWCRS